MKYENSAFAKEFLKEDRRRSRKALREAYDDDDDDEYYDDYDDESSGWEYIGTECSGIYWDLFSRACANLKVKSEPSTQGKRGEDLFIGKDGKELYIVDYGEELDFMDDLIEDHRKGNIDDKTFVAQVEYFIQSHPM